MGCGGGSPSDEAAKAIGKGDTYFNAGLYKEALSQYQIALDTRSEDLELRLKIAQSQLRMGLLTEALSTYDRALELDPASTQAYRGKAELLLQAGRPKELEALLEELKAKPGFEALVAFLEGEHASTLGRHQEAIEKFRLALEKDPGLELAARGLAKSLLDTGDHEQAISVLADLSQKNPNDLWVSATLANLYQEGGENGKAIEILANLVQKSPSNSSVRGQLALAYLADNQLEPAKTQLAEAVGIAPNDSYVRYVAGQVALAEGDYPKAIEQLTQASEDRPEEPLFRDALREARVKAGLIVDEVKAAQEQLTAQGESVESLLALTEAYVRRGEPDPALESVEKALAIEPENREARILHALVLYLLEQPQASARALEGVPAETDARAMALRGLMDRDNDSLAKAVAELRQSTDTAAWAGYFEARGYLEAGQFQKAFEGLDAVASKNEDFAVAYYELARLYQAIHEEILAMVLYQRLIDRFPESPKPKVLMARLLAGSGNIERAKVLVEGVLAEHPEYEPARFLVANIDLQEKNYDAAADRLGKLAEDSPTGSAAVRFYRGLQAQSHVFAGRYAEAAEVYQSILEVFPGDTAAILEKSLAEMAKGDLQAALETSRAGIAAATDPSLLRLVEAVLLARTGKAQEGLTLFQENQQEVAKSPDLERALAAIEAALQSLAGQAEEARKTVSEAGFHPLLVEYFEETLARAEKGEADLGPFLEGLLLTLYRWPDAARASFQKFQEENPESLLAIAYLGESRKNAGLLAEAMETFGLGLKINPEDINFLRSRAEAARNLGDFEQANRDYLAAIAKSPEDAGLQFELGQVYEAKGLHEDAIATYRRALKLSSSPILLAGIHNNLAWLLAQKPETLSEATEHAEKALESFPQDAVSGIDGNIYDTVGWIYFLAGQKEKAMENIQKAVRLLPHQPTITYHLARVFEEMGQPEAAAKYYMRALHLNPEFPEAEDARPRLGMLRSRLQ
jgi:tetratricopeptide (TPR) repeat protein